MKTSKINLIQQEIAYVLLRTSGLQSSAIYKELVKSSIDVSLVTVKRELATMLKNQLITQTGAGRYVYYSIAEKGRLLADIDYKAYVNIDPDSRYGLSSYNFGLIPNLSIDPFSKDEIDALTQATFNFIKKQNDLSTTLAKKELERLVIELSWKSSKIEGNTYTLLDTERLIRENIEAPGHPKDEATMILNHKSAFNFIWENRSEFKQINKNNLSEVHKLLTANLNIATGYRNGPVGVTGSIYKPLDNIYQIEDAMNALFESINDIDTAYQKALSALICISYIQPFEDGNKRTSRLMANALLLANDCAPLSYRGVDEEDYRAATLAFYELNTIIPIKRIFIKQYIAATELYSLNIK